MTGPIRLALNGASGRMGNALLSLLAADRRFELVHAVIAPGSPHAGHPVGAGDPASLRYSHGWVGAPAIDVVVDFSGPAGLTAALDHCLAHHVALVSGTTGIGAALETRLASASRHIAILRAANFSLGVAMLTRLLRDAATSLPNWDMEIVEAHHGRKLDAPSGTALALGQAAAAARGTTLEAAAGHSYQGRMGERIDGSIGFAVIRGGDIVGEHTAMLIGQGERLELTHRATDRSVFARGALQAAHWLSGRVPGQWRLDDVIAPLR